MSDGVKCGGGLSGRKYVSAAEDCSVGDDHKAEGDPRAVEAMLNEGRRRLMAVKMKTAAKGYVGNQHPKIAKAQNRESSKPRSNCTKW